jgi:hypothetical protein
MITTSALVLRRAMARLRRMVTLLSPTIGRGGSGRPRRKAPQVAADRRGGAVLRGRVYTHRIQRPVHRDRLSGSGEQLSAARGRWTNCPHGAYLLHLIALAARCRASRRKTFFSSRSGAGFLKLFDPAARNRHGGV